MIIILINNIDNIDYAEIADKFKAYSTNIGQNSSYKIKQGEGSPYNYLTNIIKASLNPCLFFQLIFLMHCVIYYILYQYVLCEQKLK